MEDLKAAAGTGITCNICEEADVSLYANAQEQTVWICKFCGTAFTHPQPQDTKSQYCDSYFELYAKRHSFRINRATRRLAKIELLMEPGKILDVGCSLGYFVEAAKKRGWDSYGVEISEYAAEVACKAGLNVRGGILEEAHFEYGFFDCVTMWDVLEHVPDPTEHIKEVKRILAPGGMVVIGTPDLSHPVAAHKMKMDPPSWRHFKPAEHLYYFTPDSLRLLLRKSGFRMVEPPLFPRKPGLAMAAFREMLSRVIEINDVMTMYGVLDGE